MRLSTLDLTKLDDQQRELYDRISAKRGPIRGPYLIWLRNPGLCESIESLSTYVRWGSSLSERISELGALIVAKFWGSPFPWVAHVDKAIAAGVDAEAVEALAQGRTPAFRNADETVLYEVITSLLRTHQVPDDVYASAVSVFGEQGLIDLMGVLGTYSMLALCLNMFQQPVQAGKNHPFEPTEDV